MCLWFRTAVFLLFLLGLNKPAAASHPHNATTENHDIVCVYPISGQYGPLNRLLYYVLWAAAAVFQRWTWPSIGSLAYIMAHSGSSAVHGVVLAVSSKGDTFDLDTVGAWAILSVAVLAASPIVHRSERLRDSVYRPVFGFWASTVTVGAICTMIAFLRDYPHELACWSRTHGNVSTLLVSKAQLQVPGEFNCSYGCFAKNQMMRVPSQITVITVRRAFQTFHGMVAGSLWLTAVLGFFWGMFMWCFVGDRKRTKAELQAVLNRSLPTYATISMRKQHWRRRDAALKELRTGKRSSRRIRCLYLNVLALPIVIGFNEVYMLYSPSLPTDEKPFAVGQWAPWVTVVLALIAAAINAYYEPKWERIKEILDEEHEAFMRNHASASRHGTSDQAASVTAVVDAGTEGTELEHVPSLEHETQHQLDSPATA